MKKIEQAWASMSAGRLATVLACYVAADWRAIGPGLLIGPCPGFAAHEARIRLGTGRAAPIECPCGTWSVTAALNAATKNKGETVLLVAGGLAPGESLPERVPDAQRRIATRKTPVVSSPAAPFVRIKGSVLQRELVADVGQVWFSAGADQPPAARRSA